MHMAYASLCITWKFERDLKEGERAWPKRRNGSSHYVFKALEMESEIGKFEEKFGREFEMELERVFGRNPKGLSNIWKRTPP
jgi:hypothetical protein